MALVQTRIPGLGSITLSVFEKENRKEVAVAFEPFVVVVVVQSIGRKGGNHRTRKDRTTTTAFVIETNREGNRVEKQYHHVNSRIRRTIAPIAVVDGTNIV